MTDVKNQHTLFRFISLRSPELSKEEDKEKRSVILAKEDKNDSVFITAVNDSTDPDAAKLEKLITAAESFTAYSSKTAAASAAGTVLSETAIWLAQNPNASDVEVYNKIDKLEDGTTITNLAAETEVKMWDNLIYQVITQSDFYLKEFLIELLRVNYIVKQKLAFIAAGGTGDDFLPSITKLRKAKVVLPAELFDESVSESGSGEPVRDEIKFPTQPMKKAASIVESNLKAEQLENAIAEVKSAEKNYSIARKKAFDEASKTHQVSYNEAVGQAQQAYKAAVQEYCKYNKTTEANLESSCIRPVVEEEITFPEFSFTYRAELEELATELSEEAYFQVSEHVDLASVETYAEVNEKLGAVLAKERTNILQQMEFTKKVVSLGKSRLPVATHKVSVTDIFQLGSIATTAGKQSPYLVLQMPHSGFELESFDYTLTNGDGTTSNSSEFKQSGNDGVITISHLFGTNGVETAVASGGSLEGTVTFTNGAKRAISVSGLDFAESTLGYLEDEFELPPIRRYGVRNLGIADYRKVVSEVCCYEAGEVAHIENVMARELREKNTKKTHRSEVTETDSLETENENLSDVTSTGRFEMQTEIEKMIREENQKSVNVNATVGGEIKAGFLGGTKFSLSAGYSQSNNTSKEQSNRQALTEAQELTERAMSRVVSKIRSEKTVKITDEFVEENKHAFDNREGDHHVSGVYRFVNAIYKNQIHNYGKRLTYEFLVPQPSKLHRLALDGISTLNAVEFPEHPSAKGIKSFGDINKDNYLELTSKYGASVEPYPQEVLYLTEVFNDGTTAGGSSARLLLTPPKGYAIESISLEFGNAPSGNGGIDWAYITIGTDILIPTTNLYGASNPIYNIMTFSYDNIQIAPKYHGALPISLYGWDIQTFHLNVSMKVVLENTAIEAWQVQVYDNIMLAYQQLLSDAEARAGVQILDDNPLFYREIEQSTLKQNCISYLQDRGIPNSVKTMGLKMYNGSSHGSFQVQLGQSLEDYASFATFMEQAFDWELMSYQFYPYYWGNKAEWSELYQFDSDDPLFRAFMRSGMARVVVTVRPGFEEAVMYYMATGQIWNGGELPGLDDELYLSIVDELAEPVYTLEETWKTVMPTNLVALQNDGVGVNASGLPCLENCPETPEDKFEDNTNLLGGSTDTPA